MLDCERALAQLNDFLDGTLSASQAVPVSTHLERCRSCRHEYQALKATQAMLRAAALPSGDEARERVLARFRHTVGAQTTPAPRPRRWFFAPVGMGAMVTAAALALMFYPAPPPSPHLVPPVRVASADTLPSPDDLAQMNALHNMQSYAVLQDGAEAQQDTLSDASFRQTAPIGAKSKGRER